MLHSSSFHSARTDYGILTSQIGIITTTVDCSWRWNVTIGKNQSLCWWNSLRWSDFRKKKSVAGARGNAGAAIGIYQ